MNAAQYNTPDASNEPEALPAVPVRKGAVLNQAIAALAFMLAAGLVWQLPGMARLIVGGVVILAGLLLASLRLAKGCLKQPGGGMSLAGGLLLLASCLIIPLAVNMDTTVRSGNTRVHNVGLVSERQLYLTGGGVLALAGVLLLGFGAVAKAISTRAR